MDDAGVIRFRGGEHIAVCCRCSSSCSLTRHPRQRNSDLAFWGKRAYAGHYDGFQIVDISNDKKPRQLVDFSCPGSQHDVSVWDDLLFVSVETPRTGGRSWTDHVKPPA